MDPVHTSVETITAQVGRWDLDIAAGWEAGLLGKTRVGGRLFDRHPPEHFLEKKNGQRLDDWIAGRDAALRYRKYVMYRSVHFVGNSTKGEMLVVRKGWGVRRGEVITQLEKNGCFGDVRVYYFECGKIARTVEGLAEFKTAAAPQLLGAQILGTLRMHGRALSVIASISPYLAHSASSQGAAN